MLHDLALRPGKVEREIASHTQMLFEPVVWLANGIEEYYYTATWNRSFWNLANYYSQIGHPGELFLDNTMSIGDSNGLCQWVTPCGPGGLIPVDTAHLMSHLLALLSPLSIASNTIR